MLSAYRAATAIGQPLTGPLLWWRTRKGKEDADRRNERHGIAGRPRPRGPLVWFHAASVGETLAILPLLHGLTDRHGVSGLLTTGTVTSARMAAARLQTNVVHQYVPLDGRGFVRRFLDHWRPGLAVFAESELWPNMILETSARKIPLALVNARMSERSYEGWQRGRGMISALLSRFDVCLAQSEADARRLAELGADGAMCSGNLKFDVPAPGAGAGELARLQTAIGARPRWAAVSTHPGEDELVLDAHLVMAQDRPKLLTIIAPRHPDRAEAVAAAARTRDLVVARRSAEGLPGRDADVFIVDTIGELGLVFRVAPVTFMGGSLVRHGGQNPIEPAKLGSAILHGPHVGNFAEVYAALDEAAGAEAVNGPVDLAQRAARLVDMPEAAKLRAKAAAAAIRPFGGALERTAKALDPLVATAARGG